MDGPDPKHVSRNALLAALPPAARSRILGRADRVALPLKRNLLLAGADIDVLHFVEVGTISMVGVLSDGGRIEVGLVGREGLVGLPFFLGNARSQLDAVVQTEGWGWRMSATAFRSTLADTPELGAVLLRYLDVFLAQVVQTAVCNGRHKIEQRLARWLLMTHDRAEDDTFTMTQEFLSNMLGVRRPGVTMAMGALRRAGLVKQGRGSVRVLDRAGLERAAANATRSWPSGRRGSVRAAGRREGLEADRRPTADDTIKAK